jgi:hypothetical protein
MQKNQQNIDKIIKAAGLILTAFIFYDSTVNLFLDIWQFKSIAFLFVHYFEIHTKE